MKHLKRFNTKVNEHNDVDTEYHEDGWSPEYSEWIKDSTSRENTILRGWKFRDMIGKCVDDNCKEIPYEGTEIDKHGIIDDIIDLLEQKYIVKEK